MRGIRKDTLDGSDKRPINIIFLSVPESYDEIEDL